MFTEQQVAAGVAESAEAMCRALFDLIDEEHPDRPWGERVRAARCILHESAEMAIQACEGFEDEDRALARVIAIRTIEGQLSRWHAEGQPGATDAAVARARVN